MASFSAALSALNALSTGIDVVGNNLANIDTTGFKDSTVSFHDLVTESVGAGLGETQVGFGVGTPVTLRQFTQGAVQTTSGPLDAAIQGDGFFIVQDPSSGAVEYTRGGNFQVDQNGNLTTTTGELVQGWTSTNGAVNTNGPTGNITVPTGTIKAPVATQNFSLNLNLNSQPSSTATPNTFSTSIQVYDSLGNSHVLTVQFTQSTTPGQWNYSITVPNSDVTSPFTPVTGTLSFDQNGNLTSPSSSSAPPQIQIQGLSDGAADLTLNWQLYDSSGNPRITQYAQTSAVSSLAQDGSASAQLVHVGIANGGQIVAQYSDGQQTIVGQLAMATIRNPESLIAVGNNNFQMSAISALPAIGVPGTGGRGTVVGGAVESSNVDIATQFTNLIVLQRGYEANAKVVTTIDQLSQDTIALKQ